MVRDRLRGLMAQAKTNLRISGSLTPTLVIEASEASLVGIADMPATAEGRRALMLGLGRRFAKQGPWRVTAVLDAYMKATEVELPLKGSLADDPAATECVVVASLDNGGRSRVLICPYEREPRLDGLRIHFKPVREQAGQNQLFLLTAFFEGVRRD